MPITVSLNTQATPLVVVYRRPVLPVYHIEM